MFMLTAAAIASAKTAMCDPDPFTKPKYLGEPRCVAFGRILSFQASRM